MKTIKQPEKKAATSATQEARHCRILLVEDDPVDRRALAADLKHTDFCIYHITEAATVREASELAARQPFDCVLLDYKLPDGDALDLLEQWRDGEFAVRFPVVVLSGQGNEGVAVQALQIGAQEYIVKGQRTADSLTRAIEHSIRKHALHRELEHQRLRLLEQSHREKELRKEAESAYRRAQFLAEASGILASSLDYQGTLQNIAKLAVPTIADWCIIDVLDNNRTFSRALVSHGNPEAQVEITALQHKFPIHSGDEFGVGQVVRTGEAVFFPAVSDDELKTVALGFEHLEALRGLRMAALIIVPMRMRDQVVGAITLACSESGRCYDNQDLQLAQTLADRAAAAIENARLFQTTADAREQLRQQYEMTRSLTDSLGEGLFAVNADCRISFFNPAAEHMLGWRIDEAIGRDVSEVIHGSGRPDGSKPPVCDVVASGKVYRTYDDYFTRKDTTRFPVAYTCTPMLSEDDTITGAVVAFHDISERKAADAEQARLVTEIESHRKRLNDLLGSVPGVVWETWGDQRSPVQRVDFVSDYIETMVGYSAREWLGKPSFWLDIVHPEDRVRAAREAAFIFNSGKTGVSQYRWVAKGGQEVWVESHAVVIRDKAGTPIGMRGVTMDITPRKKAEEALRESEHFFRSTLDGLSAHIAILNEDGAILAVNRAWREMAHMRGAFGAGMNEGANYLHFFDAVPDVHQADAKLISQGIRDVISGERETFALEYPHHVNGQNVWHTLRITRFPGQPPGKVVVAHENITARKTAEEALRRRAQELAKLTNALERSNRELDQFAYVTSHDLKAPLRGISNLAKWIEEDLGQNIAEETRRQLHLMRGRVHRMEKMIEAILQYSRVGRVETDAESVDVEALLKDVIDLLSPPESFNITVQPGMPAIRTERLRLEQVFMNLVGNAIKYHNDPEAGNVEISCIDNGDFYEFTVADNGPGIAPQFHDRIYGMFQRLESRDKVEGTGIGLSLVKKIVESKGGTVSLVSDLGKGSAFSFTWPKG